MSSFILKIISQCYNCVRFYKYPRIYIGRVVSIVACVSCRKKMNSTMTNYNGEEVIKEEAEYYIIVWLILSLFTIFIHNLPCARPKKH